MPDKKHTPKLEDMSNADILKLFNSAWESYCRHCPKPIEAAKSDLLGELIKVAWLALADLGQILPEVDPTACRFPAARDTTFRLGKLLAQTKDKEAGK